MRVLSTRRIASSALCTALLLGAAVPVALAADAARDRANAAQDRANAAAPLPGADALMSQAKPLSDAAGLATSVNQLVEAVLKADNGQLPATEANRHRDAIKAAIDKVAATPVTPTTSAGSTNSASDDTMTPADLRAGRLADLDAEVEAMVAASVSGLPADIGPLVNNVLALVTSTIQTILGLVPGVVGGVTSTVPGVSTTP
jgi:hypothetical protein